MVSLTVPCSFHTYQHVPASPPDYLQAADREAKIFSLLIFEQDTDKRYYAMMNGSGNNLRYISLRLESAGREPGFVGMCDGCAVGDGRDDMQAGRLLVCLSACRVRSTSFSVQSVSTSRSGGPMIQQPDSALFRVDHIKLDGHFGTLVCPSNPNTFLSIYCPCLLLPQLARSSPTKVEVGGRCISKPRSTPRCHHLRHSGAVSVTTELANGRYVIIHRLSLGLLGVCNLSTHR